MPSYKDDNGKWFCKFYYEDWTGHRQQKKKSGFQRKKDADKYERDFLELRARDPDIPFGTFTEKYISTMEYDWKPTTTELRKSIIKNNFLPYFKDKNITDIEPLDIKHWQQAEIASGLGEYTVYNHTNLLTSIFAHAVKFYGLRQNPCILAGNIRCPPKEMNFLTIDEFKQLIDDPEQMPRNTIIIKILFWTGIRISECLALTVGDIESGRIHVCKNKVRVGKEYIIQEQIKNNRSRYVKINPTLERDILKYINHLYGHTKDTVLFPITRATVNAAVNKSCEHTGVKRIRVHDLRHSHVALLIHMGYFPKAIADRIGDSVNTVLKTYAHIYEEDEAKMINELEEMAL